MASHADARTLEILRFLQIRCGQGGASVFDRSAVPEDHITDPEDADSNALQGDTTSAILTGRLSADRSYSNPRSNTYKGGIWTNTDSAISGKRTYWGVCTSKGRNNGVDIREMITVFGELPDTADLRSSKVETRMVGPPAPPVVLWTRHTLSEGRG